MPNQRVIHHFRNSAVVFISAFLTVSVAFATTCKEPTPEKRAELAKYVSARYHVASSDQIVLLDSSAANSACFWKLHYEIGLAHRDVTLYLSPDQGFLVPDVYDIKGDPVAAERIHYNEISSALTVGRSATRGPEKAKVSIVEFSDFECPYCRRMTDLLEKQILPQNAENVRVVFHEFPLPMHPWAKSAAQIAECVRLQNVDSFWRLHDYIFQNQQTLKPDNLRARVTSVVASDPAIKQDDFNACVDQELTLGPVQKDMALGQRYGVHATPTIFINGVRVEGLKSAPQLQAMIESAAKGEVPADEQSSTPVGQNAGANTQCNPTSTARVLPVAAQQR